MDAGREARTKEQIKFFLSEGKQRLKELTDMLGLALPAEAEGTTVVPPLLRRPAAGGSGCAGRH